MRIRPIPTFIVLAVIVGLIGMWQLFERTESGRYEAARKVRQSRSEIRMELDITHQKGPIASESYRISDIEGVSAVRYSAANRSGITVHVDAPARKTKEYGSDVAYMFGQAVQDGIWDLQDRPPRGDTSTTYTISVSQVVNGQSGQHRFTFTDPHYWASTGGHQFEIKLDKNKPVPDLVQMKSTALVEPRYGKLIADFTTFGSPGFRSTVAAQREKLAKRT